MPRLAIDRNGYPMLLADAPPKRPIRIHVQAPPGPWMDSSGRTYPRTESKAELSDGPTHTRMPAVTDPDLDLVVIGDVVEQMDIPFDRLLVAISDGRLRTFSDENGRESVCRRDVEQLADGASESDLRAARELLDRGNAGPTEAELDAADALLNGGRRASWRR